MFFFSLEDILLETKIIMQKLLSIIAGAAFLANSVSPQFAAGQDLMSAKKTKVKPLNVAVHLDHKLSTFNGHQGALTAMPSGGLAPYTYKWSTGSNLSYVNGLTVGNYAVTVTDARGAKVTTNSELGQLNCETASCEFRTQTQGGFGADPHGNNSGVYVHANFAAAFPNGLVVGCTYTLTLDSAQDVTDFLPSGSTPSAMTASLVNPGGSYTNVLAGQVVTLALNIGFDNYDAGFGTSTAHLADLVIASGDFAGMTVQQLFDAANEFLGGCASPYSASDLNDAVTAINENFDDGTQNKGYLLCPQASDLEVSVAAHSETCAQLCNGSAEANVTGGSSPFSYLWNNNATDAQITGLCPGNYSVTVTDALGCTASDDGDVDGSQNHLSASISKNDVTCNDDGDGSINITIDEGTGPYVYTWTPAISNSASASNLAPGQYQIHIADANGCETDVQEEIIQPDELIAVASGLNASCLGSDGSAHAEVTGGTEPYAYLWSPSGGTAADESNIGAGVYTVVVTDAHGCTANDDVAISAGSMDLSVSGLQNATCPGQLDGSATVDVSGGSSPYSYVWSPSGGTDATATGLAAGLYTVTVNDAAGCQSVIQVEIGNINQSCNSRFASSAKETSALAVYPSMISNEVKILSSASSASNAVYAVSSLDGKIALTGSILLQPGKEVSIDTHELATGIYSMTIVMDSQNNVFRIVKK